MNFDRLRQLLIQKAIEGKLIPSNSKKHSITKQDGVPFAIPQNWQWVSLSNISPRIHYGFTASATSSGTYHLLRITDIKESGVDWSSVPYCQIAEEDAKKFNLSEGDIVIARTGGTIGKSFLIQNKDCSSVFASYLIRVIPDANLVFPEFLIKFMESPTYWSQLSKASRGTGQPNVNTKSLGALLVPLPPIEEQRRIVARLNELLSVIKQAEDAYTDLQSLGKTLRERILQKAIEGKLVPQLDEESAVEQIGEAPAETPFAIPHKWRWEYLQTVSTIVAGQSPKGESLNEASEGMEFHQGKTDFSDRIIGVSKKFTTEPMKIAAANSVLMSVRAPVGDVNLTDRQLCIGRGLFSVLPQENIDLEFLFAYLQTTKKHLESLATGTTFKAINGKVVRQIAIPVPPLAEQHRIVAKLNELLPLIDQMTAV